MCGILGIIKKNNQINIDGFKCLNKTLSHRGPDGSGIWVNENKNIALAHRRLSIIDIEQGIQPMKDKKGNIIITFNGEIYNFLELKKELIEKGYMFDTNSDTEVIIASYIEWGEKCLEKLRGMFAFAIVDKENQEVFLANDQFGIKPLIYYTDGDIFCFSSEINTLAKIENINLEIDYSSIDLYLWLQYIPSPKTIYKKMYKLKPAHYMKIDFEGNIKEEVEYWRPEFKPNYDKNINDWLDEFEEVIKESIKAHSISDVPVGAFLSGGIDSTITTKYLSENNKDLRTFSIGFKEKDYNELGYSDIASKKFMSKHATEIVSPDFFSILNKLVKHYGEPFGDSSAIPTYYVSKLASEQVKVVLSGDGGDELFGGYNSYKSWQERLNKKNNRPFVLNIIRSILSNIHPKRYIPEKPDMDCWLGVVGYYVFHQRKFLWKDNYRQALNKEYNYFDDFSKDFEKNSIVHKAQLFDIKNYLPYCILRKVDIASMMNGLEVRVPFLDKKVAEFALTIPEKVNQINGEWEGKYVLKKSLEKDFSDSFIYRQKKGFAVPLDKWFGEKGALYPEPFRRLMNSDSKLFKEVFNSDAVYNFLTSGEYSKIYFLLFLEEWFIQYENRKDLIKI